MAATDNWKYSDWRESICNTYGIGRKDAKSLAAFVFDRDLDNYDVVLDSMLTDRRLFKTTMLRVRLSKWWESVYSDSLVEDLYWHIVRTWDKLVKEPLFRWKMRRQRAKVGYCDLDVWNVDVWLTTVLPKILEELAETCHGYPTCIAALMDGKDPETYDYPAETTKEDSEKFMSWWKAHLRTIAFCFREANEDTCSIKNEYRLPGNYHFEEDDDAPFASIMVDDSTEEELAEKRKHLDKELELSRYRRDMFRKGMEMLAGLHGMLWD